MCTLEKVLVYVVDFKEKMPLTEGKRASLRLYAKSARPSSPGNKQFRTESQLGYSPSCFPHETVYYLLPPPHASASKRWRGLSLKS